LLHHPYFLIKRSNFELSTVPFIFIVIIKALQIECVIKLQLMLLLTQVETIRDAYMVVAGVPNKTTFHAHHICDMALDMLSSIDHLKDPSTGDNIQIRVGMCTRTHTVFHA